MNLEIHDPERAQRVQAQIQSGQFHDTDELIEKALDALDVQSASAVSLTATGAVVLAALQSSPYPDTDLMPPSANPTSAPLVGRRSRVVKYNLTVGKYCFTIRPDD